MNNNKIYYFLYIILLQFIFIGCDDNQSNISPLSTNKNLQQNINIRIDNLHAIKVDKYNIYEGEEINFSLNDQEYITSAIWKDQDSHIISKEKAFTYQFDQKGSYTISVDLIYEDQKSRSDHVTINVSPKKITTLGNQSPIVDAGQDVIVHEGDIVVLKATATDPDGIITKYVWEESNSTKAQTQELRLENLPQGSYLFIVTVTDNKGATAKDSVKVLVKAPLNNPPQAYTKHFHVYSNESIMVRLLGTDADNQHLTYRILKYPKHGKLTNGVPNTIYTSNYGYIGLDSFTYVVNDGFTDSKPAIIYFEVVQKQPAYVPPAIDAGANFTFEVGEPYTILPTTTNIALSGVHYCWRENGTVLAKSKELDLQNIFLDPGVHQLTIDAVNTHGIIASDVIIVTVTDPFMPIEYTYDASHRPIIASIVRHGQTIQQTVYTYDQYDRILTKSIDYENDGITNLTESYTYDQYNNMLTKTQIWSKEPHQAFDIDIQETFTYDAWGNNTSRNADNYIDNIIDSILILSYDDQCRAISIKQDNNANGNYEVEDQYIYDVDQIKEHKTISDYDDDGVVDSIQTQSFNQAGDLVQEITSNEHIKHITTYAYDSNHILTQQTVEVDMANDGTIDYLSIYTFNTDGDIIAQSFVTYYYDNNKILIRTEYDDDGDGTIDRIEP